MTDKFSLIVEEADAHQRIDKYLGDKLSGRCSRSLIKKMIEQGKVWLNGDPVKAHHKIKPNDRIEGSWVEELTVSDVPAMDIPLDIVYEDEHLIVLNKPPGIVVHPAAGHFDDTLVNALLFKTKNLSDVYGTLKLGIVHRLDKDTSGLLVVAKDNVTHGALSEQFKQHAVKKIYIAIVRGIVEHDEGVIDAPITRSPFNRKKMTVMQSAARQAVTNYRVIKRAADFTVLEVQPKSGRTHQIRVHMAHIGHPLVSDPVYGGKAAVFGLPRQALHAKILGFTHPDTQVYLEFEAPVPEDMARIIRMNALPRPEAACGG
ncbi:MAG: RluA family pseudouridine synthase [Candidatus Omnitrophica bacterium]|nr:RluA family pseudouridine synthase [Candidatus Omnitrophota bacterium]